MSNTSKATTPGGSVPSAHSQSRPLTTDGNREVSSGGHGGNMSDGYDSSRVPSGNANPAETGTGTGASASATAK